MSTKRTTKTSRRPKTDTNERLAKMTQDFIDAIESGAAEPNGWTMPWEKLGLGAPRNIVSRKRYSGMNHLLLALAAAEAQGAPLFATYKQWQAKHLQVAQGETGELVIKWIEVGERNADGTPALDAKGNAKTFMVPKVYSVFGVWQVVDTEGHEGARARLLARFGYDADGKATGGQRTEVEAIEAAEQAFAALGADVCHGGDRAYYSKGWDFIQLPERNQFRTAVGYASTKAHEFTHWTGHASRLGRDGITGSHAFGSDEYAFEELVAELGAAFFGSVVGYATEARADHAQYLASWVRQLQSDPKALLRAASQAEKAVTWMAERAALDLGDDIPEDTETADVVDDETVALAA